jgi:hypothetical protein
MFSIFNYISYIVFKIIQKTRQEMWGRVFE